jgi:hypothetical protein
MFKATPAPPVQVLLKAGFKSVMVERTAGAAAQFTVGVWGG